MEIRQRIWLIVGLVAFGYVLWILLAPRIAETMFLKAIKPVFFVCPNVVHTMTPEQAHIRLRKDPHDELALRVLQDYYASLGEWQKALSFAEKLVDQGSKDPNAYLGVIYAMVNLGREETAKKKVQDFLKKHKSTWVKANLWRVLGDLYLNDYERGGIKGSLLKAERAYANALALDLGTPMALLGKGRVVYYKGDLTEAKEIFQWVASRSVYPRERAIAKYYIAHILWKEGKTHEAANMLRDAVAEHPNSFTGVKVRSQ